MRSMSARTPKRRRPSIIIRDAALISALAAALALTVNAARTDSLPIVAAEEYAILVPCPVALTDIEAVEPSDPRVQDDRTLLIDARTAEEFAAWHLEGARNVVNDYLDPVPESTFEKLVDEILETGVRQVVVYGDGDDPDSGWDMGRQLAGKGMRNVFYVNGGAPALRGDAAPSAGQEEAP